MNKLIKQGISFISSPYTWVVVLTLLGAILRRYHLASKSLWVDEAMLYDISQGSFADILHKNAVMSSAPPLYPLILHAVQVFGDSELILKYFSMLMGILSIPLAYIVFRKFISTWAALGATLLVAIAPSQITYSQQVREYSFTFLLALGMILTTWMFLQSPRWRNLVILVLVWLFAVWTQYGLAALALALNLLFLIFVLIKKNSRQIARWIPGQVPILASIVVIYLIALRYQFVPDGSGVQYLGAGYWDPAAAGLVTFVKNQTIDLLKFTFPEIYLFSAAALIGVVSALFFPQQRERLIWIFVPLGLAILLGILRLYPYLGTRHNIYLTPVLYLACGFGIQYLLKIDAKKIAAAVFMIFLTVSGINADVQYYHYKGVENIRPVLAQLQSQVQPGDQIYVYYAAEWQFRYYMRNQPVEWISGTFHRDNPELYFPDVEPIVTRENRTWLLFSHCYKTECEQIRDYVATIRQIDLVARDNDVWLYLAP